LPDTRHKYTLVLDLDETLVHLVESEQADDGSYCYFRPGVNYFLKELSKHYEIVVFTAAMPDVSFISVNPSSTLTRFWTHWTLKRSGSRTDYTASTRQPRDRSQCKW